MGITKGYGYTTMGIQPWVYNPSNDLPHSPKIETHYTSCHYIITQASSWIYISADLHWAAFGSFLPSKWQSRRVTQGGPKSRDMTCPPCYPASAFPKHILYKTGSGKVTRFLRRRPAHFHLQYCLGRQYLN